MNTQKEARTMISKEEAAKVIGRSTATIQNLVTKKSIPHYKVAGRLMFSKEELNEWLDAAKVEVGNE